MPRLTSCEAGPAGSSSVASASGAWFASFQVSVSGVASTLPARSTAQARSVWSPSASTSIRMLPQLAGVPSIEHSKRLTGSSAVSCHGGRPWTAAPFAFPVSVVFGGVRSIVNACEATLGSRLPAVSVARTVTWWAPSSGSWISSGDVHADGAAPSREHSNVAGSSASKLTETFCALV